MAINESMLPELEREMATIRLLLGRVPAERAAGKPDPKSMSLGQLASHVADLAFRGQPTIQAESSDPAPPEGEPYRTRPFASREWDVPRVRSARGPGVDVISGTDDARLTMFAMPPTERCVAAGHLRPYCRPAVRGFPAGLCEGEG